jgi:hypothetical protein
MIKKMLLANPEERPKLDVLIKFFSTGFVDKNNSL